MPKEIQQYFAHSPQGSQTCWETILEHSNAVAKKTAEFSKEFGFEELGRIAGLLHDTGKYQKSFQAKIKGAKNKAEHAACGAKEALEILKLDKETPINAFNREILTYIIAGHHTGLCDCGTDADNSSMRTLKARLKRKTEDFSAYKTDFTVKYDNPEFWLTKFDSYDNEEKYFAYSILTRMLYSALVDSDSLETEKFYTGKDREHNYSTFEELKVRLDDHLSSFPEPPADSINHKRNEIQRLCAEKSKSEKGIYSLTVSTGGGKTLSSMVFAINHLLQKGHKRIIYVIPYTAIIEQTAKVFKDIFGEENVLEHHSNFTFEDADENAGTEETSQFLATENWDAPIILTTNVQFFSSLFSDKRGSCRKIHNIANSVIVFDEAQMLPIPYLKPCLKSIDILVRNFGCTALLMSATCPDFLPYMCKDAKITEINENLKQHYIDFKRISAEYIGIKTNKELVSEFNENSQTLVVVNSRKHASELYNEIPDGFNKYHLSTLMYPEHRKSVIAKIKQDLSDGKPCIVISTQLIECGVDLDFAAAYRSLAGVDSIVQAGGRCNREGKRQNSKVYIFEAANDLQKGDIPIYKSIARTICENPAGTDLFDEENINKYFTCLLNYKEKETDRQNIMGLFRLSQTYPPDENSINYLKFNFAECNKNFHYIDDADKFEIIINANDEINGLIDKVRHKTATNNTFRNLGKYTVSIYRWEYEKLRKENKLELLNENGRQSVLICKNDYSGKLGLLFETSQTAPLVS
jgi:CRISPR-associated endonuclease/helicase Cas3